MKSSWWDYFMLCSVTGHDWATGQQQKYCSLGLARFPSFWSSLTLDFFFCCCCCSVTQLCPTLWDPMGCSTPGLPVRHYLPGFAQTRVHWVGDAIQSSILSLPLLLPAVFPSIRVFSSELALHVRWPEYWSFSFNISPSSEYSYLPLLNK